MARLLIVEDNPDLLEILERLFGEAHEVATAQRGDEAIERASERRPDLVILDMQLPVLDGREVGLRIKEHYAADPVPILILTALAQTTDPEELLASGCCDRYLAKPAPLDDIRTNVEELLEQGPAS
ncbi:MAG: response regulator [Longimicrobiales bacterium]